MNQKVRKTWKRGISLREYCVKNHMEYLLDEWDKKKNKNLMPEDIGPKSHKKIWWLLSYDDKKTGKHFDFSWQASAASRVSGTGCPYLSGKILLKGFNDLATTNPELAKLWHPTKNGNLTPEDVTEGSSREVWWLLSCKDSKTGKCLVFERKSSVNHQSVRHHHLYPEKRKVYNRKNNLAVTHPELAAQWHPTRNGNLKPEDVLAGSNKKAWWILSYDDENTGKHFDFEWESAIVIRTTQADNGTKSAGCPYLSGHKVWRGFNDLATTHPELAAQWHPVKNGKLTPEDVTAGSHKDVWWILPYDDPKTGKHFNFEWKIRIESRVSGSGCPYLSGRAVWKGFNDLKTTHPELAVQWHPVRNGSLMPEDVAEGSIRMVWWQMSYDDKRTGKHFNFEWESQINSRVKGAGCPYLSGLKAWKGFNDLATTHPGLAAQWHPVKNGKLTPGDVVAGSIKKVWWLLSYDDKDTGKHFDFSWQASIRNRANGSGCPYLSGYKVWKGFNDLETYCKKNGRLDILSQWDYEKNGSLNPSDVFARSSKKVWWIKDGKSFLIQVNIVTKQAVNKNNFCNSF